MMMTSFPDHHLGENTVNTPRSTFHELVYVLRLYIMVHAGATAQYLSSRLGPTRLVAESDLDGFRGYRRFGVLHRDFANERTAGR